jgi:hypothetical protein
VHSTVPDFLKIEIGVSPNFQRLKRNLVRAWFMKDKKCLYCRREFLPSRYHPEQEACPAPACQLQRRTDYHRRKIGEDSAYREQCRDSQRKWREQNPSYMKTYAAARRKQAIEENPSVLANLLRKVLRIAKNNVAIDLCSSNAKIWLVAPDASFAKNILASAQIIVIQARTAKPVPENGAKRTSL